MEKLMKKRVLLLADNLGNGGAERQLTLLAKNIPDSWDVFLWSLGGGPFLEQLAQAKISHRISYRKFRFDVLPFWDLCKQVNIYKPNVIHSWGWMSTLAGIFISKVFNIPLVNGIIRSGKPYYYRGTISRLLSKRGTVIVSNSWAGLRNWGVPPSRAVVIYNGFETNRLIQDNQTQTNTRGTDGIFRIVMAARMVKAKDFGLFVTAARRLWQEGITDWKFLAVGHGEDRTLLINQNLDLIEAGILEFPEAGLEVLPFLQQSNVGVLLSRSAFHEEGCSNAIMEYMACGLPVIATNNGGNKELVDSNTGFLVEDGNLDDFISKLLWLFTNRDQAKEMGKNAQNKLLEQFSVQKMVENTIDVYRKAIEKGMA